MLNFKTNKLKTRLLMMRWAVLGSLVLAVGAVAVWGGARPEQPAMQSLDSMLTARQTRLAENKTNELAHIGDDTQAILPAAATLTPQLPEAPGQPAAANIQSDEKAQNNAKNSVENNSENNNKNDTENDIENNVKNAGENTIANDTPNQTENTAETAVNTDDNGDIIDNAPEPWVGDELLTVEASLQQMLPPISGMQQDSSSVLRKFGYGYDADFGNYNFHRGVDLAGSLGAAVLAPLAGTVKEIKEDSFLGGSVVLEHDGKLQTGYFGLKPQPGLQIGQQVIAGEKLGEICPAPPFEESLAPHLHWEISLDGEAIDPAAYGFGG